MFWGLKHRASLARCFGFAGGAKPISDALKLEATQALAELAEWHVQSGIDGGSNIWILKPGGKSRGRGISCTNSWADIKVWRYYCSQL